MVKGSQQTEPLSWFRRGALQGSAAAVPVGVLSHIACSFLALLPEFGRSLNWLSHSLLFWAKCICRRQRRPVWVCSCCCGEHRQPLCWVSTLPAFKAAFSFSASCWWSPVIRCPLHIPLGASGRLQAHADGFIIQLPNTNPEQTLRASAGNHLVRKALWIDPGPWWKLGSALHPLLNRRLLTHSLHNNKYTRWTPCFHPASHHNTAWQLTRRHRSSDQRTNCVCSTSVSSLKMPFR